MTRKHKTDGVFTAALNAADESIEIASSLRSGHLTRKKVGAWYEKRRKEGASMAAGLRETAYDLARPLDGAIAQGRGMLHSMASRPAPRAASRPVHRRRARKARTG